MSRLPPWLPSPNSPVLNLLMRSKFNLCLPTTGQAVPSDLDYLHEVTGGTADELGER
jgi:hypothetical protein